MPHTPTWLISHHLPTPQNLCTIIGSWERISSAVDLMNEAHTRTTTQEEHPYRLTPIPSTHPYPHLPTCPDPDTLITDYGPTSTRLTPSRQSDPRAAQPNGTRLATTRPSRWNLFTRNRFTGRLGSAEDPSYADPS